MIDRLTNIAKIVYKNSTPAPMDQPVDFDHPAAGARRERAILTAYEIAAAHPWIDATATSETINDYAFGSSGEQRRVTYTYRTPWQPVTGLTPDDDTIDRLTPDALEGHFIEAEVAKVIAGNVRELLLSLGVEGEALNAAFPLIDEIAIRATFAVQSALSDGDDE